MAAVVFLFAGSWCSGQNLIKNPSFEDWTTHRDSSSTGMAYIWHMDTSETNFYGIRNWWSPTLLKWANVKSDSIGKLNKGAVYGTWPRTGQAHGIILTGGNETNAPNSSSRSYYQGKFTKTLDTGCFYRFQIFLMPFPWTHYQSRSYNTWASDAFGAFFSVNSIQDTSGLFTHNYRIRRRKSFFHFNNLVPQVSLAQGQFITDTIQYTKFQQTFQAKGGEQYITLGSFKPVTQTSFKHLYNGQIITTSPTDTSSSIVSGFLFDDLSLYKVSPPASLLSSSRDTTLCPGDTLWLEATSADSSIGIKWDNGSTPKLRPVTAPGTYWVELDCGCDKTLIDTIVVGPSPGLPALSIEDTTLCPGKEYRLQLPPQLSYQLNGISVPSAFSITDTGSFVLDVSNGCYTDSYSFRVYSKDVKQLPHLQINDTSLCGNAEAVYTLPKGFSYSINNVPIGGHLTINEVGQYKLAVANGCDFDTLYFEVNTDACQPLLFVPNAFTPNHDAVNDVFLISVEQYNSFRVQIFNRWGQLVFMSTDPENSWDGKFKGEMQQGVFSYKIEVRLGQREVVEYGSVSLLK